MDSHAAVEVSLEGQTCVRVCFHACACCMHGHEREGTFGVLLIHGGDRTAVNRAENMAHIRDCLSPPVLLSQCHRAVPSTSSVLCHQPISLLCVELSYFCNSQWRICCTLLMEIPFFFFFSPPESQFPLGFIWVLHSCVCGGFLIATDTMCFLLQSTRSQLYVSVHHPIVWISGIQIYSISSDRWSVFLNPFVFIQCIHLVEGPLRESLESRRNILEVI